jgi:transmembrane sensor
MMKNTNPMQRHLENQAIEWLVRLNSPNLTEADITQFNQWLAESPANQLAYIKAEQTWHASAKLVKISQKKSVSRNWQYALAGFLLVVCVSFYQYKINVTTDYEFHTGIGEQKTFDLVDGSHVTLNNQSRMKFSINHKSRKVQLLSGEVLFKVAADVHRPFDIESHDGMIRVVGTTFSVNRYFESTLVTVVEGRVALGEKPLKGDDFVAAQVLTQSQQQTLLKAIKNIEPAQVDIKTELAWRDHQLIARNETLANILTTLEKAFPVKFVILTPGLGEKRVTAVLNLSDLDQVLLVLEASLSLQIERTPTEIRLSEKNN